MNPTTQPGKAEDLIRAFLTQGYEPGAPQHLSAVDLVIYRRCARSMICGDCGHRGLKFTPLHRGHNYAAVAGCPRCGAGEEM